MDYYPYNIFFLPGFCIIPVLKEHAMKSVVLIGDSIRIGYQETVKEILAEQAEVWAPGENGGTSRKVMSHLDEWIIQRKPDLIHLNCGLHDLRREPEHSDTFIPAEEYRENLRKTFAHIRKSLDSVLIFALTTPVNQEKHHKNKPFDRFEADVEKFNRAAAQTAEEFDVPVNDLCTCIETHGKDTYLQDDGVHFTEQGYLILAKAVAEFLSPYLKDV